MIPSSTMVAVLGIKSIKAANAPLADFYLFLSNAFPILTNPTTIKPASIEMMVTKGGWK
ncbi:hypothetical protein [Mergibacter septicus]|uniref:hypothetical protein n=1 Tax=Mergibacter septicus TaxID=221402 RepID=UPI00223F8A65|nr:hypothetical protein [Mergibacter septicus]